MRASRAVLEVRATSLICLVGVGIGFGSYLLYRLWNRFMNPALPPPKKRHPSTTPKELAVSDDEEGEDAKGLHLLSTPDSGVATMGHSQSNSTVITPDTATVTLANSSEGHLQARYRGKPNNGTGNKETVASFAEEDNGFLLVETQEVDKAKQTVTDNVTNQSPGIVQNDDKPLIDLTYPSLSNEQQNHLLSSQILEPANENEANLGHMDRDMMLSTSTDLGFVSGHYSGHESSMERSGIFAQPNANALNSQFERDMNSNLSQNGHAKNQIYSSVREDSNGNIPRFRNFSDSSVHNSEKSDASKRRSGSFPTSPGDTSIEFNTTGNSSFELTKTMHSTPTDGGDVSPFDSVPRTRRHRPPSAPLTGSSRKAQRCYSPDISSASGDGSYCLWTGNSVDLGENFSGRSTPDSEALRDDGLSSAVSNYDQISEEVQALRLEMDEMNEKLYALTAKDNVSYLPPPLVDPELLANNQKFSAYSRRVFRKHNISSSSYDGEQSEISLNFSEDNQSVTNLSDVHRQSALNWDYNSDLGAIASQDRRSFMQNRPVVDQDVQDIESHHSDRMQRYLIQQSESLNNTSLGKHTSIQEEYIDDNYLGQNFPKQSPIKEESPNKGLSQTGDKSGSSAEGDKTVFSPVGDNKGVTCNTSFSSIASAHLCEDCQSNCMKCGKKMNANNNNSESETSLEGNEDKTGKVTEKVAHNSTQTDCVASTQTEEIDLRLSATEEKLVTENTKGNGEMIQNHAACPACNLEMPSMLTSSTFTLIGGQQKGNVIGSRSTGFLCTCGSKPEISEEILILRPPKTKPATTDSLRSRQAIHIATEQKDSELVSNSGEQQQLCACANSLETPSNVQMRHSPTARNAIPSMQTIQKRIQDLEGEPQYDFEKPNGSISLNLYSENSGSFHSCQHCSSVCPTKLTRQFSAPCQVPDKCTETTQNQLVLSTDSYKSMDSINISRAPRKAGDICSQCSNVFNPLYERTLNNSSNIGYQGSAPGVSHVAPISHSLECPAVQHGTQYNVWPTAHSPRCDANHIAHARGSHGLISTSGYDSARSAHNVQRAPAQGQRSSELLSDLYASNLHLPYNSDTVSPYCKHSNIPLSIIGHHESSGPPSQIHRLPGAPTGYNREDSEKDLMHFEPMHYGKDELLINLSPEPVENKQSKRWEVVNIGPRKEISEYVKVEWKGTTEKARLIRKGYADIESLHGLRYLRQIRGDNYCALRATVFQVLVNGIDVEKHLGSLDKILQDITRCNQEHAFLRKWTFANRFAYDRDHVKATINDCVTGFYEQLRKSQNLSTAEERENFFVSTLNSNPDLDLYLHEAVKCLMMVKAIEYFQKYKVGEDVPTFVWLLFARDTSETPEKLLLNHLNKIGDSGGMEMVEMFLLSHTLGVQIVVARPFQQGKVDFVTNFPDEGGENFPKIYLVAEDDRHYNVLLPEN